MSFRFADVVIVGFPFTAARGLKQRPAVVISKEALNDATEDVILMPITSRYGDGQTELPITEWRTAGLLRPSAVKPNPYTFLQSRIVRTIGTLAPDDATALRRFVASLFG
jgi:mRNA interferase MazF